jgi:glutaminyl-peptide cyclotransferase
MMCFVRRMALVLAVAVLSASCAGVTAPKFDEDMAWGYLLAQCSLGPRVPGTAAHEDAVRLLTGELEKSGWKVTRQTFTVDDPYGDGMLELTNIIGKLRPKETRRVLLVAHYDTRPRADQETVDSLKAKPIPGANDGASGVAVLLALANIVGGHPPAGLGIDIVFFDGEDYGKERDLDNYLLGSKHFAANLHAMAGGYHPVCAILLDMVGGTNAVIREEANSLAAAPEVTNALFERATQLKLNMFEASRGIAMYDDHIPLLMAGIKTVDLIDPHYPYWHTLGDTPEHCSKESLRQTGTLLIDFLYNFPF